MIYLISDIAKIINGIPDFHSGKEISISHLLIDSRSRETGSPENTLFFAIKGERNNGHVFIRELFERGIQNFVVSENPPDIDANFIKVKNTVSALQLLAAYHRQQFNFPVIGITGSNGKTIVKEWLHHLLSPEKNIVRSPKSYNSQVGVPLSVWQMKGTHEFAIFEAGISKPGEMVILEKIIKPTIGIITNLGGAHDASFENRKQKANEKLKLFENSEVLFYCSDYDEIDAAVKNFIDRKKTRIFTWSRTKEDADLKITAIHKSTNQTRIEGVFNQGKVHSVLPASEDRAAISITFADDASIENAIHCWLILMYFGYENSTINERMQSLQPVAMRLEQKEGINQCTIINDSYNSDIGSLAIALDFLNGQNQHGKKTLILSDILQSGKEEEKLYAEVADMINNKGITRLVGIGKSISLHFNQFELPEKKFFFNTGSFLEEFNNFIFNNEAILLKGARSFGFERINSLLQKKSHETVLEIHLNSLVHNLNFFRSRLKPATKIMAMVKAFSYGSGSFEIANVLQFHRVDYLAVAYTDEGVELRNAGITLPIMVMNPEEQSFDSMLKHRLEPEIYSFRLLNQFSDFLKKIALKTPFSVHLKIDTGMHRLGFSTDTIDELILRLKNEPSISIKSVFSHLSASDEPQHDDFTQWQIAQFNIAKKKISDAFSTPGNHILSHILNSSGAMRFPEFQMDMVRLGIGLYGVAPDDETQRELQNVAVLKTTISQIKKINKGESIGYNRSAVASKELITATVPIGYADGFSRKLGNGKGKMIIKEKPGMNKPFFVPTVGNVCMDMCMLDITGIDAREGDEVIVFGSDYPIAEVAKDAGTIPYEILTGISRRVKRVYFQE